MVLEPSVTETMAATNSTTIAATSLTMAASSSSSFPSSSSVNVLNQPLLLLSNMANMMTIKLDNTNYIVWRHQITMVLKTYSLFELIEKPQLIPDQYLKDLSGAYTTVVNPDFLIWKSKEKALLTFTSSILTPTILAITMGCSSALKVWKVLENRFSSISRSHVLNLKGEFHNIKKGTDLVDLYLQKIKVVRDKLLAVGVIMDDEELLHITLKGLLKEYNAFRSTIRTRSTHVSFNELSTMFNVEDESLNDGSKIKDTIFAMAATTTPKPNNNGFNQFFNRGRGRDHSNNRGGRGGRGSNGLNSLLSISFNKFNLILMVLSQKGQFVKFVERLVIWHLIVTIGWTMLIKESIHQPNLQLWPLHPMLASIKISPGLLIVLQQIMLHPILVILAFLSPIKVKIRSL